MSDLSQDPIIVGMALDLVNAGVPPARPGDIDEGDYVFAAAMEFSFRGGDLDESLPFSAPAEAVRVAYDALTNE